MCMKCRSAFPSFSASPEWGFSVMCDSLTYMLCILVSSSKNFVAPEIIQKLVLDLDSGVVDAWHHPALEQVICERSDITQV